MANRPVEDQLMVTDRELWACALFIEKHCGDGAAEVITERMFALAREGDTQGVATWRGISDRYDQLRAIPRPALPI